MRKKILAFVFGAALLTALAVPAVASAAQGGVPNGNACYGQAISDYAHNGATTVGEVISADAQSAPGARAASVQAWKAANCP